MTDAATPKQPRTPAPPQSLRTSLERAIADGRALLERDAPVAIADIATHRPASAKRPRTVGAPGAVMAVTLGVDAGEYACSGEFSAHWGASLGATAKMAAFDWAGAWCALYGKVGPADTRGPSAGFASRVATALGTPWSAAGAFKTAKTYRAWLERCARDVIGPLGAVEEALVAEHEATCPPPAPDTLARALRVALADGRARANASRAGDTRYTFDSTHWHASRNADRDACAVCAAGCVMAGTLRAHPTDMAYPPRFGFAWERTLRAIDALRSKEWRRAYDAMHGVRHAGGDGFAQTMCDDPQVATTHKGAFAGLVQLENWLDHVETALLPRVIANEGRALENH